MGFTPLGRVFKIHNIFLHYFIGFLTSINYMDKWGTPLGMGVQNPCFFAWF